MRSLTMERFGTMWPELMRLELPRLFTEEIRVDEFTEDDGKTFVIRAELPGVDPERDVELSIREGMLHLRAERKQQERGEREGWRHSEFRYGMFERVRPLPPGSTEKDVTATYKDGILEIRVPVAAAEEEKAATKIPVQRG